MPLDPRYITSVDLEPYLVDKNTGQPLANGIISFFRDTQRTVPKLVYQLIDAPPYAMVNSYAPLPNPVIVSQNGTIQDAAGNNVALYYFPYDVNGNLDLYYIVVTDQFGNEQFTREAWPYPSTNDANPGNTTSLANQIKNPQFSFVSFIPPTLTVTIAGAGSGVIPIAPEWNLNYTSTGASTITITRNSIAGNTNLPFNPPYTLTITPGVNLSLLTLTQLLPNNPGIWAPQPGGLDGWIATSVMLSPGSAVTINYVPSNGALTQLLMANNTSGVTTQYNRTVQLPPSNNINNADTGFINIVIILSTTVATTLGNIQILGVETNQTITYTQSTVNQQLNGLFSYYNPLIQFKPIPSYLVGWNFALNPAQFLGPIGGPFNTGANSSNYIWDGTIVFQSVTNSFSFSRGASGALVLSPNINTQLAIIQYLPMHTVNSLLYEQICVMVEAACQTATYPVTVSIWYTANANLPSTVIGNISLVNTLDANGHPNSVAAGWTELARGFYGNATFTVQNPGAVNGLPFNYYPFNGWGPNGIAGNTATFMAIVVGTGVVGNGNNFSVESISLQKGNIPTVTGGQTHGAVMVECQRYYEMSFNQGTVPAQNVGAITGEFNCSQVKAAGATQQLVGYISYKSSKAIIPNLITTYNPAAANGEITNETITADCSATTVQNNNKNGFFLTCTNAGGSAIGNVLGVHWTSDARLGY